MYFYNFFIIFYSLKINKSKNYKIMELWNENKKKNMIIFKTILKIKKQKKKIGNFKNSFKKRRFFLFFFIP